MKTFLAVLALVCLVLSPVTPSIAEVSLPFGTIVNDVQVGGKSARTFTVGDETTTITCDYTVWGRDNAVIYVVLLYVAPDSSVHAVKTVSHGTGNTFPGVRKTMEAQVTLPKGISFFYVYVAPVLSSDAAVAQAKDAFDSTDGKIKHFGVAFTVERKGESEGISVGSGDTPDDKTITLDLGNKATMRLVRIPAGKLMMGSPGDEVDRNDDEGPQREVTISRAFYLGVYEVTQEQYQAVMERSPSHYTDPAKPVETVSWDDAMEFCRKLSRKSGRTVTLPTEAQWEYACRAGSNTRFCFGDDDRQLGEYARCGKSTSDGTAPVGSCKPNAWGLYDMHGNVLEWCSDWYAESYANAQDTDATGPPSGSDRVLRGGSWLHGPAGCRSANRIGGSADRWDSYIGFRVVVDLK